MEYDQNVLQAIAYINLVLATRQVNLWPDDIKTLQHATEILDKLRSK